MSHLWDTAIKYHSKYFCAEIWDIFNFMFGVKNMLHNYNMCFFQPKIEILLSYLPVICEQMNWANHVKQSNQGQHLNAILHPHW